LAFFIKNHQQTIKKIPTRDLNGFYQADIKGIGVKTLPIFNYRQPGRKG